jgi:hypothetical protein
MFVPRRDATVPPGRATRIIELVFPGVSAVWQWAGPVILLLWCTGMLGAALQVTVSSTYLLMAVVLPGMLRAFGYPSAYTDLNPPMFLLVGAPIALWLANAILLRSRRVSHDMP